MKIKKENNKHKHLVWDKDAFWTLWKYPPPKKKWKNKQTSETKKKKTKKKQQPRYLWLHVSIDLSQTVVTTRNERLYDFRRS